LGRRFYGAIDGAVSTNIGVTEPGPLGTSLQLTDAGTGTAGHGFNWTSPTTASEGMINTNQTITNTTTPSVPWINEIHYDNNGTDANEGIEIVGPVGLDLDNYCVQPYNGNGGGPTGSEISLRGETFTDEGDGFGSIWIPIRGLQNGAPDGIAFYRKDNVAMSFCSGKIIALRCALKILLQSVFYFRSCLKLVQNDYGQIIDYQYFTNLSTP